MNSLELALSSRFSVWIRVSWGGGGPETAVTDLVVRTFLARLHCYSNNVRASCCDVRYYNTSYTNARAATAADNERIRTEGNSARN